MHELISVRKVLVMEEKAFDYVALKDNKIVTRGLLNEIINSIKKIPRENQQGILIFNLENGQLVDYDLAEISSTPPLTAGRPKIGVVSREVTLLPEQWQWLSSQRGGASATLRRLVSDARRKTESADCIRVSQETTYRFMNAVAGDLEGFEEALRALYRREKDKFSSLISNWPVDIRRILHELSENAFKNED
ncbi:DUF2239 family protein [Myxococcota bacterium]|nr:DUF2239 family protein [Myxococcota bacterium]MBU1497405.1 DUF2239 family protein [Myxococcota bacterium]